MYLYGTGNERAIKRVIKVVHSCVIKNYDNFFAQPPREAREKRILYDTYSRACEKRDDVNTATCDDVRCPFYVSRNSRRLALVLLFRSFHFTLFMLLSSRTFIPSRTCAEYTHISSCTMCAQGDTHIARDLSIIPDFASNIRYRLFITQSCSLDLM